MGRAQELTQRVTKDEVPDAAPTNSASKQTASHPSIIILWGYKDAMNVPQLQPPLLCGNCSMSFVGQFCPGCGWSISSTFNSRCWKCGSTISGRYCTECGADSRQRPDELVNEDAAAARGAIQGGVIWGLFSRKENRARNALLGAAWGGLAEQGHARQLNELFQLGASISAITTFRARRTWAGLLNLLVVLSYFSLMALSGQATGAFVLSALLTWPLLVVRERVTRWSYESLDYEQVVRASFGQWVRADVTTVEGLRRRRAKVLLVLGVSMQVAVGLGTLS